MFFELDEEFNMRVKHNFKLYVLLTSKSINWKQDDILDSIYRLNGYKCHKAVKYEMNSSHIHVKFEEEHLAQEAVDFLNNLNTDLTAVLVDDMLRDWFNYELRSGHNPPWTLTIVDIIGSPPLALNFLTENILNSIFRDLGDPYLLPYTAALNEPHVQILFGSMTEALAACMAFGEWHDRDQKIDSFFYRVRINPSDKEATLIRNSGGTPNEAFKLDYFVNVRREVTQRQKAESDKPKTPRYKNYQNKGIQKIRKQKFLINAEHKQNVLSHQVAHRTPILCVPIITPFNSYAEALMASGRQHNVDFANAILNIRQTCSVSTQAIVDSIDSETDFHQSIQDNPEKSSSCNFGGRSEQLTQISELGSLDSAPVPVPERPDLIPQKPVHNVAMRQKLSVNRGTSRLFERRK